VSPVVVRGLEGVDDVGDGAVDSAAQPFTGSLHQLRQSRTFDRRRFRTFRGLGDVARLSFAGFRVAGCIGGMSAVR